MGKGLQSNALRRAASIYSLPCFTSLPTFCNSGKLIITYDDYSIYLYNIIGSARGQKASVDALRPL